MYGIASIDTLLPLVVKRIEDTNIRIRKGKNGRTFKEIQQYISGLEPLAAAAITCKITFDKVFGYKDSSNLIVTYVIVLVKQLKMNVNSDIMKNMHLAYLTS